METSFDGNISIRKLILHILDANLQIPVLSDQEHPMDGEIVEFIEKHITKILKDDNLKKAVFVGTENRLQQLCTAIAEHEDEFIRYTSEIAAHLFDIMQKNVDIPSADLVCCLFYADNTPYLGILKFNYRASFIHYIHAGEPQKVNTIIKQKTTLPAESQRVEECAMINLSDFSIQLLEKKYEVNGEKIYYFSTVFLNCTSQISLNEKVKLFTKATEKFNKKYFEEDYVKPVEIRKAVAESIEETNTIDIVSVADQVFKQNPEMKREYIEHIQSTGLREPNIPVNEKIREKNFRRQKIKTDSGIEINLPVEFYGNKDKIEFINNPDGTISILIKNIGGITEK